MEAAHERREEVKMTSVSGVETASTSTNLFSAATGSDNLGKDDFLNLLVAELQNQNPLDPMDNKDFVSQMAQFSSLEQLTNMSKSMDIMTIATASAMKASQFSLVGKNVTATIDNPMYDPDLGISEDNRETIEVSGAVERLKYKAGLPFVTVEGYDVSIADITESW